MRPSPFLDTCPEKPSPLAELDRWKTQSLYDKIRRGLPRRWAELRSRWLPLCEMRNLLHRISELKSAAKEAVSKSLLFAKFLCLLHVTDTYLCSPIIVRTENCPPVFLVLMMLNSFLIFHLLCGFFRCTVRVCCRHWTWPEMFYWQNTCRRCWGRWVPEMSFLSDPLKTQGSLLPSGF